jgi:mRNA interferase RelE/StbE
VQYLVQFKVEAEDDLRRLSPDVARRVLRKVERLQNDLAGDVKRLVHYTPGWRLRVGDWRVLFHVEGDTIWVWRVVHRSEAYE